LSVEAEFATQETYEEGKSVSRRVQKHPLVALGVGKEETGGKRR
jgi:hypothetical protein